jgi:hypothetical protein
LAGCFLDSNGIRCIFCFAGTVKHILCY